MEKDRLKSHANSGGQRKAAGQGASANLGIHKTKSKTRVRGAGYAAV